MTKKNQDGGCCGSQGCGCDVKAGSAGECRCGETCRCSSCPCDAQAGCSVSTNASAPGSADAS
jgi:hypothetical protein